MLKVHLIRITTFTGGSEKQAVRQNLYMYKRQAREIERFTNKIDTYRNNEVLHHSPV